MRMGETRVRFGFFDNRFGDRCGIYHGQRDSDLFLRAIADFGFYFAFSVLFPAYVFGNDGKGRNEPVRGRASR